MKLGTSIKRVVGTDADRFHVELEYTDGFRGVADLSSLFGVAKGKPMVLEILRGDLFEACFVESGALAWPNGYELCPDWLRQQVKKRGHRAA